MTVQRFTRPAQTVTQVILLGRGTALWLIFDMKHLVATIVNWCCVNKMTLSI